MDVLDLLVLLVGAGLAVALTVGSLLALDRWGVWGQLSGRYHRQEFPTGRAWWFRSGKIGRWRMQGTLLIAADERGLWLAWGLPFLRSRALHIPWSEIEVSEQEALLWLSVTELRFPAVPEARIELSGRWQQALASASGGQLSR